MLHIPYPSFASSMCFAADDSACFSCCCCCCWCDELVDALRCWCDELTDVLRTLLLPLGVLEAYKRQNLGIFSALCRYLSKAEFYIIILKGTTLFTVYILWVHGPHWNYQ